MPANKPDFQLGKMSFYGTRRYTAKSQNSHKGIEVDKEKVEVIVNLPPSVNEKGTRSFLGHASFYRRFIRYFSKIAKPLTNLLVKDKPKNLIGKLASILICQYINNGKYQVSTSQTA